MLPIFKWSGGKRKEIQQFKKYFPKKIKKFVEPFVGGGAVYWKINHPNSVINDIDFELVNFYQKIKEKDLITLDSIIECAIEIAKISNDEKKGLIDIGTAKAKRNILYNHWKNLDKKDLNKLSLSERAARFYIVNQLSFNGMRRFNGNGEFNIPYGNYKGINFENLFSNRHISLLQNTQIYNNDYKKILVENDEDGTFIFLDPPYTKIFNEYSKDEFFKTKQHLELFHTFSSLKNANAMIILNNDPFTSKLYKDYIIDSYPVKYTTNIKNRFNSDAEHLVITNYLSTPSDGNKNPEKHLYNWIDPTLNMTNREKKGFINKIKGQKLKSDNLDAILKTIKKYKGKSNITQKIVKEKTGFSLSTIKRNWKSISEYLNT